MSETAIVPVIPIVYVAGRFRGLSPFDVRMHVIAAERVGLYVAESGAFPFIPQANTAHFDGTVSDQFWLDGTLAMLARCDAIIMVDNWALSTGATIERLWARDNGIRVFYHADRADPVLSRQFEDWIAEWKAQEAQP